VYAQTSDKIKREKSERTNIKLAIINESRERSRERVEEK